MAIDFTMNIPETDVIAQESIPYRKLYTGAQMPAIGLGTFNNDRFSFEDIGKAVYKRGQQVHEDIKCKTRSKHFWTAKEGLRSSPQSEKRK